MTTTMIKEIKQRRSIRSYTKQHIHKQVLEQIIQAGRYAPSAKNDQPWRFIVITNKEKISWLSNEVKQAIKNILKKRYFLQLFYKQLRHRETLEFLYGVSMVLNDSIFFEAPAVVLILTRQKEFYDESCACCAENMMLAAHSLGIGSCWIGFTNFLNTQKKVLNHLQVPEGYHISSALVFGYSKDKSIQTPLRKPMSDVINWIE